MLRKALLSLLVVVALASSSSAEPIKTVAEVFTPDAATIDRLLAYDLGIEGASRPDWTRVVAYRPTIDELGAAGFEVNILIEDLAARVAARNAYIRNMPVEAAPVDVELDHYLTHEEMGVYLTELAAAYPDIMSVRVLGDSVGGRALYEVKISDNVEDNEPEPAIYFEHNIHGDEIAGYILALYTIEYLVTNYATDPEVQALVDGREIFIEPLTNPDGNVDGGWYGRDRYNANGVDLNRNYGFMWDPDEWNSGSAPHSEPETVALTESWMGDQPFMAAFSGHSGTVIFLYAWGYVSDDPLDIEEFEYLGGQYIYPNWCQDPEMNYHGTCGQALYIAVGVTNDEQYGSHGMLGMTYELTYTKECTFTKSLEVCEDHIPAIKWFLGEMGNGLHGTVTEAGTGDPVAAVIAVEDKWITFSDAEVGDFHKYLRAGSYNVRVFANGYDEQTLLVNIVDGAPTNLNVVLTPAADPQTFAFRWLISEMPNSYYTSFPTVNVLGAPDSDYFGIGYGGWLVLDLGPDGIADGAGADLMIYEANDDGDEAITVYGSTGTGHGPWVELGGGEGTVGFDLNAAGLSWVRYVKIVDENKAANDSLKAGPDDGYDLDAVGTPAFVAAFSGTPREGSAPLNVQFTDQSTGSPTSWDWDFGDGAVSTLQHPSHEYDSNGLYTVSLTVVGPEGTRSLIKTDYINVADIPPEAEFTAMPLFGQVPLSVQFSNASTGSITGYAWNFGDGGTSTEESPLYVYETPGNFSVTLTVTGPAGTDERFRWRYIHPSCAAPTADFSADTTTGPSPLTVQFTNLTQTADACPATYLWRFGDEATSTQENPSHVYQSPGTYTVTLTATNNAGSDNEEKQGYIVVQQGDDDDDDDNDDNDDNNDNDDAADDDAADDDAVDDDAADDDTSPTGGNEADDDDDSGGCGC